jgi:hypothetical protein
MVEGRRACGIGGSRFTTPVPMIGMVGGRPCLWLRVDGQWSMVVAMRSRSMGCEAREGMVRGSARIRCCRGIGWGAGQLASVLVTPTMGTWGLGRRYRAVAWMALLCILDADLFLQEMLTRR